MNTWVHIQACLLWAAVQPYLQQSIISASIQKQKQHLNCTKFHLNMNIVKHSLQHGHSRARRQHCALCLERNEKNSKWLLAITTTKETGNHQLCTKKCQRFSVEDIPDIGNPTYEDLPALWVPVKPEEWQHNGLWDGSHRRWWALSLCRKRANATEIKFLT